MCPSLGADRNLANTYKPASLVRPEREGASEQYYAPLCREPKLLLNFGGGRKYGRPSPSIFAAEYYRDDQKV